MIKNTRYLDAVIAKMHERFTEEELSYISRHLEAPYYRDGDVALGLRAVADAQHTADGNRVAKVAQPAYPQASTTRECANCTHIVPRTQGIMRQDQFFCLRCDQQRQVA